LIADVQASAKWKAAMGDSHAVRVEARATGSLLAIKLGTIPRGIPTSRISFGFLRSERSKQRSSGNHKRKDADH
jgi:hypothetical protein